jgi:glycogen debranching enzyme
MERHRAGRSVTGDYPVAEAREWLVTNGRGGYAMGTVAGSLARRYHGLLIAALAPPVERRLLVAACELTVAFDGRTFALGTNRWMSGAIAPEGYRLCESFALIDGLPTWTYACGDALIEVTIAMPAGADATALAIRSARARGPVAIGARMLFADRDHHGGELPDPSRFAVAYEAGADSATIGFPGTPRQLTVHVPGAVVSSACERYEGYALAREAERGLPARDDYAHLLDARFVLDPGDCGGIVFALDADVGRHAPAIVSARRAANRTRIAAAASPLLGELTLAADAFIVERGPAERRGRTVIAGYPWFADWGRDTMIALPGLTLATGRPEVAREILSTFAATVDGGMLPNRFPDDGSPPEYNTVDAALWFIEAVRAYVAATNDDDFLRGVFPALRAIVDGYRAGTRYGIGVGDDGLVHAGVPGVQLTWMDAKVGDRVITPRIGKPVEINALWYAGLRAMEAFALRLGFDPAPDRALADRCAAAFERFWDAGRGYCADVLDGPGGDDWSLRPNQLFALALHASPLDDERARAVVDACARDLLTSHGLRTLAPGDPAYIGRYGGDQAARDAAYHQGTVWPWLMGPFVRAHLRVYRDRSAARTFVRPLIDALAADGIGTLAEIFEGDPPHAPRGCSAQAWSVAAAIELVTLLDLEG